MPCEQYPATNQYAHAEPTPSVGFTEAAKDWWGRLFQFTGRSSRSQYWWGHLFLLVLAVVVPGVLYTLGKAVAGDNEDLGAGIILVCLLFLVLPWLSSWPLEIRRLHDAGFSGWWVLLRFVPLAEIAVFVMTLLESKMEGARFDGATKTVSRHSR